MDHPENIASILRSHGLEVMLDRLESPHWLATGPRYVPLHVDVLVVRTHLRAPDGRYIGPAVVLHTHNGGRYVIEHPAA